METIKLKILDEAGHTLMTCDADTAIMALEIYHSSRPTYTPDARCITLCVSPKCVRT